VERTLVLPLVINSDKYEVLCMQFDMISLNVVCAIDLIYCLFCGLFNNAVSSTDYIASDDRLINK
jgi:hypothetical protein